MVKSKEKNNNNYPNTANNNNNNNNNGGKKLKPSKEPKENHKQYGYSSSRLTEILVESQTSSASHKHYIQRLSLVQKLNPERFKTDFINHLNKILIIGRSEPAVEVLVSFLIEFISCKSTTSPHKPNDSRKRKHHEEEGVQQQQGTENQKSKKKKGKSTDLHEEITTSEEDKENEIVEGDEIDPIRKDFSVAIVVYLSKLTDAKEKVVRYRATHFLSQILRNLHPSISALIDEYTLGDILDRMIERTKDKVPGIRAHSISSLSIPLFQSHIGETIVGTYIRILESDPSREVRRLALNSIPVTKRTIPYIVKRTRDIAEDVRKIAFRVIADNVHISRITISQRVGIIGDVLRDRSHSIKETSANYLLNKWLTGCSGDTIKMLGYLDVPSYEEEAILLVSGLYKMKLIDPSPPLCGLHRVDPNPTLPSTTSPTSNRRTPNGKTDTSKPAEDVNMEPVDSSRLRISSEAAILFYGYCQYLKKEKKEDELEEFLPTLLELSEQIRLHKDSGGLEFVIKQLVRISMMVDGDEVGKGMMSSVIREMLAAPSTPLSIMSTLMECLVERIHVEEEEYIRILVEIISDIKDPLEGEEVDAEEQYNEAQRELQELQRQRAAFLKSNDKTAAASLKTKIASKEALVSRLEMVTNNREKTMSLRCLTITEYLLSNTASIKKRRNSDTIGTGSAEIDGLFHSVILPAVQHSDPEIRCNGIKNLGLFCLLNRETANAHLLLFSRALQNDLPQVRSVAMKILFDIVLMFDMRRMEFETEDECSSSLNAVISTVQPYLDNTDSELRTACVEGFAKLFLADVLTDSKIFSNLIFQFFNPLTQPMARLRQCLSVFFPGYALVKGMNRPLHQATLQKCFLPTLRGILHAPSSSPLKDIQIPEVAHFILLLTRPPVSVTTEGVEKKVDKFLEASTAFEHKLAVKMSKELLSNVNRAEGKNYPRILTMLKLSVTKQDDIKTLLPLVSKMQSSIKDKLSLRYATKFAETVQSLASSGVAPVATPITPLQPISPISPVSPFSPTLEEHLSQQYKPSSPILEDLPEDDEIMQSDVLVPETPQNGVKTFENKNQKSTTETEKPVDSAEKEKLTDKKRKSENIAQDLAAQKQFFADLDVYELEIVDNKKSSPSKFRRTHVPYPTTPNERNILIKNNKLEETEHPDPHHFDFPDSVPDDGEIEIAGQKKPKRNIEKILVPSTPEISKRHVQFDITTNAKFTKSEQQQIGKKPAKTVTSSSTPKPSAPSKTTHSTKAPTTKTPLQETPKIKQTPTIPFVPVWKTTPPSTTSNIKKTPPNGETTFQFNTITPPPSPKVHQQPTTPFSTHFIPLDSKPEPIESSITSPVVSFSGFKDTDLMYTTELQKKLENAVVSLGGKVKEGEIFDSSVTHVIVPEGKRTLKTMMASAVGIWIVPPKWVYESSNKKKFLNEKSNGAWRSSEGKNLLKGVSFGISEKFKKSELSNLKTVISLGKGKIKDSGEVDYLLTHEGDVQKDSPFKVLKTTLTIQQFYEYVHPI